jgi:glycosyltransferase involved in cell wall biosynthesis
VNVLHAIHDFLPRHAAGSEIYAAGLASAQASRHHVTILCAEYDLTRAHGHVTWRVHDGVPVVEIVNNWVGKSFEDTYRSPVMTARVDQVLDAVQPDIVHVHNLLNLSFDLPAAARRRGVPVVATLHDHTLVCPSGGQRLHRADAHVCESIDTARCARCFAASPFQTQMAVGAVAGAAPVTWVPRAAAVVLRHAPGLARRAGAVARRAAAPSVTAADIDARLAAARRLFTEIDVFVAPSASMADAFVRLGVSPTAISVSPNGLIPRASALSSSRPQRPRAPMRLGFVGSIVWHKGVHVLIDAVRALPRSTFDVRVFGSLDTAPDYVADLRRAAADLPIRFEGPFDPRTTADVYREIDVLVVPSLWPENAPLVIQEARQAGVPVVASRIGGLSELVRDDASGWLFQPASSPDLAKLLRRLVDTPDRVAAVALAVAALRPAKSIDEDAREWDDRYRRVMVARTMGSVS